MGIRILKNGLLLLVSVTLSLVFVELFLRTLAPGLMYLQPEGDVLFASWPPNLNVEFRPDQRYIEGIHGPSVFKTNSWGIRGDEMSQSDDARIMVIGGSTTECLYLDQSEAWPALLQEKLSAFRKVWVGNLGRSGFSIHDHIKQTEFTLDHVPNLSLIIVSAGVNDFQYFIGSNQTFNQRNIVAERPDLQISGRETGIHDLYLARLLDRVMSSKKQLRSDATGEMYGVLRQKRATAKKIETLPDLTPGIKAYITGVLKIKALAGGRTRVIFLTHPALWSERMDAQMEARLWFGGKGIFIIEQTPEYYSSSALKRGMDIYNNALLDLGRTGQVEVIDIAAKMNGNPDFFYDDVHLTEAGAAAFAKILASHLSGLQ